MPRAQKLRKLNENNGESLEWYKRELDLAKREIELLRREAAVEQREISAVSARSTIAQADNRSQMSAADAKALIPEFKSSNDMISSSQWVQQVESLKEIYGWNETATLFYAASQLKEAAKFWYESQQAKINTWQSFKSELLQSFPAAVDESAIHIQLLSRVKKPDETMENFFYNIVAIGKRANLTEKTIMTYIISGLGDDQIKTMLAASHCSTLIQLLEQIKNYDSIRQQLNTRERFAMKRTHTNTETSGLARQEKRTYQKDTTRRDIVCYKCRRKGHYSYQCRVAHSTGAIKESKFSFKRNEPERRGERNVKAIQAQIVPHTSSCVQYVILEGIELRAFIDLGSDCTTLQFSVARKHKWQYDSCNIKLNGFAGGSCLAAGRMLKKLSINAIEIEGEILIVPDASQDIPMIIGRNFLDDPQIEIMKCAGKLEIRKAYSPVEEGATSKGSHRKAPITKNLIQVGNHVSESYHRRLQMILNKHRNAVATTTSEIGKTTIDEMKIELKSSDIVKYKPYRVPYCQMETLRKIVNDLLENDVIEPSTSEYCSPVVLVAKKDGGLRMCVDYRKINSITKREHFPVGNIEEKLNSLAGKKIFSSIDLFSGYHQVPVAESSRHITSFVVPEGQYQFKRVPYGLTNAGAVFTRVIAKLKTKIKSKDIQDYIDDFLVASDDIEANLATLDQLLIVLEAAGLTINLKKCQFLMEKVTFLGHEISAVGVRPGELKVKAVRDFSTPTNIKQVRQFLGLSGYFRRFVKDYARIAAPMTRLLQKDIEFRWDQAADDAFSQLKRALISEPVLDIYDPNAEHEVHTDASSLGIGAILFQYKDSRENKKVVSYFSRATTEAESKLHSYELEALAVVKALDRFRYFLIGKRFRVVTDCNSLKLCHQKRDLVPKIARWWLRLQEFDFEMEFKAGTQMAHVDALSRQPRENGEEIEVAGLNIMAIGMREDDWISTLQRSDTELLEICEVLEGTQKGNRNKRNAAKDYELRKNKLFRKTQDGPRLVIPKGVRWRVIKNNHDDIGHCGFEKTYQSTKQTYWFPRMTNIVKKYVDNCVECLYNKRGKDESRRQMYPIEKIGVPFHTIHVDHVGPFPRSKKSNVYLLGIIDAFTKYVILRPTKTTNTTSVIQSLNAMSQFFGTPTRIISDRGPAFTSKSFNEYCETNNIQHVSVAVRTPRANGQIERCFRHINSSISAMTKHPEGKDWDCYIDAIQWGLNSRAHSITGMSPQQLLFSYKPRNTLGNKLALAMHDFPDISDDPESLEVIRSRASQRIHERQVKQAELYNASHRKPQSYEKGDLVLLLAEHSATGTSRKLLPKYKGPYQVFKVLGNDRYEIRDPETTQVTQKPFRSVYAADKIRPFCQLDEMMDIDDYGSDGIDTPQGN